MPGRTARTNNIMAGVFLSASLLLAVVISFVLGDIGSYLGRTKTYTVRFPIHTGAAGLEAGSNVLLAGQHVGRVTRIERHPAPPEAPEAIDVQIAIDADLVLYADAIANLQQPILGTISAINILDIGTPQAGTLAEQGVLVGGITPPFLAQAGLGPIDAQHVRDFIADVAATAERVRRMAELIEPQLEPGVQDLRATLAAARETTESLRDNTGRFVERVDRILANVDEIVLDTHPVVVSVGEGVEEARAFIDGARATLDETRPRVGRIVENIEEATARVNAESIDRIHELIEQGRMAAASVEGTGDRLTLLLDREIPGLRRTLANARLMSDQAKLFLAEVRAQPWRLLRQPSTREMETEVLYSAARTYASAVSDLRAASASLEAVVADDPERRGRRVRELDAERLGEMTREVEDAFERYREAEQRLMDILTTRPR